MRISNKNQKSKCYETCRQGRMDLIQRSYSKYKVKTMAMFFVYSLDVAYGAPFVKILYLTDLAQKLPSLRIYSYLCADLAISA